MKWIFTISIVIFSHGFFTQDIKVFEDSLISLLKNVQTEKNTQQAKHHNIEFKAYLDNKPFIFVAMPDGTSDGMVVMELDKLEETVFALLETWDDYEGE